MAADAIVLMAGANIHGRMMVQAMVDAGLRPLVINEAGTKRAAKLAEWLVNDIDVPPPLEAMGVDVATVPGYDSPETLALLADLKPRFLVNGGCGILRDPLLSLAVPLNAHPGVLPDFRGLDPVLWSVFHRRPVGATLHVMSAGIDEGPILAARPLPWRGASSLLQLRLQCMRWGGTLVADFLRDPDAVTAQPQDLSEGAYYGAFPAEQMAEAEANLAGYGPVADGNGWVR